MKKQKNHSEKKIAWKLEKRKISELKPHPKNPRNFTEKGMKDLENSINSIGFAQPININQDNTILSGHARLMKLEQMGEVEVDVYVPDRTLTPKQEDEVIIRMNANTAGAWDYDKLANEFELPDLTDWGLELPEIESLESMETEGDDDVPEEPIKPITVRGDLYELGNHKLLCGDSTMIDEVEKLMDGEKADMVFTDPPYGMNLNPSNSNKITPKGEWLNKPKNYDKIIGDNEDFSPELINNIFACFDYCKEIFIWGSDYFAELIPNRVNGSWIVWDKRHSVEKVEYTGSHFELCWSRAKHNRDIARIAWFGLIGTEKEFDHKRHHPTQKPIALSEWFFNKWGKAQNIVVDLFGGSGSTLIACEKTARKCFMMELDEKYCDVIVKRYIDFCEKNGKKPSVKRNGEDCLKEFKA